MLNKIVDVPNNININELKKYSYYMREYLNDNLLDSLRYLYANNPKEFRQLTMELYMRGIGFKLSIENNYLKSIQYNPKLRLIVYENNDKYQNINFESMGLGKFIQDFRVNDDRFFNYIIIEGIFSYIPSFKENLLMKSFEQVGYIIEQFSVGNDVEKESFDLNKHFNDGRFEHFLNFCFKNDIYSINLLTKKVLEKYKTEKYTRDKTYHQVKERMIELGIIEETAVVTNNSGKNIFNSNIFQKLLENSGHDFNNFLENYFESIDDTGQFSIEKGIDLYDSIVFEQHNKYESIKTLRNNVLDKFQGNPNYKLIKDIEVGEFLEVYTDISYISNENKKISSLSRTTLDRVYINYINKVIQGTPSFVEYINGFFDKLKDNELKTVRLRSMGHTLEETGQEIKVTRERIRQIEKRVTIKFLENNSHSFFSDILRIYLKKQVYFNDLFFVERGIKKEYSHIVFYLFTKSENVIFLNDLNYIVEKSTYFRLSKIVDDLVDESYVINLDLFINLKDQEVEIIQYLMRNKNYDIINNNFVRSNLTISEMLEYIFREKIKKPITNNDEGFTYLSKLMLENFGYKVSSNRRSLFSRLADSKNVVLIERNTYMYDDFDEINLQLIKDIQMLIDDELEKYPYADPRNIFNFNYSLMKENDVKSFTHLYSIIKYFFSEVYDVGYQNTLYIYGIEQEEKSSESILYQLISRENLLSFEEVLNRLGWNKIKLEQLIGSLDSVILNSKKELVFIDGIEQEEFYDQLIDTIKSKLDKDNYVFTYDIYFDLIIDKNYLTLLQKYHLVDLQALSSFIKTRNDQVRGVWQFLYKKKSSYTKVEHVLPIIFEDIVSRKEIISFVLDKGYSDQKAYGIFDELIGINKLAPYEQDNYINLYKKPINDLVIDEIHHGLSELFTKKKYLVSSDLSYLISRLNYMDYVISIPLLSFIAEYLEFSLLEAYNGSKYTLPVIVQKDADIDTYEALILTLIHNEYDYDFSSKSLLKFLKMNELASEKTSKIYFKLIQSTYFEFDKYGNFQVNRGEK